MLQRDLTGADLDDDLLLELVRMDDPLGVPARLGVAQPRAEADADPLLGHLDDALAREPGELSRSSEGGERLDCLQPFRFHALE